ncbi:hypothetical protein [Bartonella jaculi]|uniref:Uncharacterized protein n=1 Tax=Bartonella jaculi TaxID=686226 RepID=A0ABP9N6E3_9HYPH
MGPGAIILIVPIILFVFLSVVILAVLVTAIIMAPYYSFLKRLRLYYKVKEQKRLMKEHLQHLGDLENNEKEGKNKIFALNTEDSSFLLKKWLDFSWKDYAIILFLSLIIIAFKVYVYISFVQEMNYVQEMKRNLSSINEGRLEELVFLLLLLVFISACVLVTIPVILMLRALLTAQLKKKIQRLEELTYQQDKGVH